MLTIEKLRAYGANVDEGLGRCFNKEDFYLRLVGMALVDKNFDRLSQAVSDGDAKEAFEACHALKGSMGNLSLTPIYAPVCALTEQLRGATELGDVTGLYTQIMDAFAELRRLAD